MIRRVFKISLPLAILAAALVGAWILKETRPQVEPEPAQEREWIVAAVPATRADALPEMLLFGEIVAGREVELRPLVAGRVIEVGANFVDGGVVRAGELLIAIDPFDYSADIAEFEARVAEARAKLTEIDAERAAARALLKRDREQMTLNRRQVERREALQGSPAGSEKALDDAKLTLSQSAQQVITRQERIDRLTAQAEQQEAVIRRWKVALDRGRRDLADTRLVAPFAGFLVATDVAIGKRVGVGDRVAQLIDAARLEAHFHLSDTEFARLLDGSGYSGRPARVIWRVGDRAFEYEAVVERLKSEIDPESGGVDLYARILGSSVEGLLRPGAFVEVHVPDRLYSDVIRLPESALYDGDTVYAVVDGRLEPRQVEVIVRIGTQVLVSGDLAPDDMVVTTRFAEIGAGIKVAVR